MFSHTTVLYGYGSLQITFHIPSCFIEDVCIARILDFTSVVGVAVSLKYVSMILCTNQSRDKCSDKNKSIILSLHSL
jgi:hypothetical protein